MSRLSTLGQLMKFLWKQKKFWLIPILLILIFLIFIVIAGESSVIAPFIYSIF